MTARQGVVAACIAVLIAAPAAHADELVFELGLTAREPGAATGLMAHIVYPDYGDQPKQQASLVVELPLGTRFDESTKPACTASDEELAARGLSACPAETEVGRGTGSVASPFGPMSGDIHLLHAPGEIVSAATLPGSDRVVVVARGAIDENRLLYDTSDDYPPSSAPPAPPGKEVTQGIDPSPFVLTPPVCPPDGLWRSRFTVTYFDGTTDAAESTTPCRVPTGTAMRINVRPRRVAVGERRRFRFHVRSDASQCLAATIRFTGRSVEATHQGRAAITRRFRRPGRRTALAIAPGCARARTRVTVVRSLP